MASRSSWLYGIQRARRSTRCVCHGRDVKGTAEATPQRLRPLSYSKAHIILIAFALDTPDSLENVQTKWIEEVREICGAHIPVMLIGCKKDIRDAAEATSLPTPNGTGEGLDERKFVSRKRGEQMQVEIGARMYKECSSLRNDGVDDIFEAATRQAMLVRTPASNGTGLTLNGTLPGRSHNNANNWAPGVTKSDKGDRRKSTYGNVGAGSSQSASADANRDRDRTAGEASKGCCVIL